MFSKLDNFSQLLFQGNPGLVDTDLKKKNYSIYFLLQVNLLFLSMFKTMI